MRRFLRSRWRIGHAIGDGDRVFRSKFIVAKHTALNAEVFGMKDRGRIEKGRRADVNVIDPNGVRIGMPGMQYDLPTGAGRLVQPAQGYIATMVAGCITRRNDQDVGTRPGRLVRSS